jgi:hypothetical protein
VRRAAVTSRAARLDAVWLVASLAGLLTAFGWRVASAQSYPEQEVKAAYIYHFGTYVDWAESRMDGDDVITIAVFGDEQVYDQLALYLPGRRIADRPVRVREIFSVEALEDEKIVFIGREQNRQIDAILSATEMPGRLIITDTPRGLRPGAAINFRRADNRIRFEIARNTAEAANVPLSSRLLASAMSVDGMGNP